MRAAALVASAALVTALGACGSNSLSGQPAGGGASSGSSPTQSSSVDASLAEKVPAAIKSAGVIKVGTDASYAPNEFTVGNKIQGADVDLFDAVAAKLGLKAQFVNANFDSIIVGVQGGKFDVGVSSFTVTADREKQVNMISYFSAGTQWATQQGNPKGVQPDNACGKTVAVQRATTQDEDDLPVRQKKCGSNPIKILRFTGQDEATSAVVSGRADAMLADSPVAAYAVKQTQGKLATVGAIYDSAPYGYVVKKDQTDFAQALAGALKAVQADGSYQSALTKWGVQKGAITDFAVNPQAS